MIKGKESVKRSKKVIFVSHCILCQSIRAQGVSIRFEAIVSPLISLLMEKNINLFQMPCPEIRYDGVIRNAVRKDAYDNSEFRTICREYAEQLINHMKSLKEADFDIVAILGIENSPTCGVNFVFRDGKGRVRESGVFIEELRKLLPTHNLQDVPILGVQTFNLKKSLSELRSVIFKQRCLLDF